MPECISHSGSPHGYRGTRSEILGCFGEIKNEKKPS